jgi:aminoglycoside phosphotransferase (APT) family kinase protein
MGGGGWTEYVAGSLRAGCTGYCQHEPLRAHDARTAALLDRIRAVGTEAEELPAGDAVHVDFHHRNVLRVGAAVSAVVDWEGCRAGDAAFDLVTLRFGLSVAGTSRAAVDLVWQAARRRASPSALRAYVAHMALRQVDWSIRFRTPADVDHWLRVSDELFAAAG